MKLNRLHGSALLLFAASSTVFGLSPAHAISGCAPGNTAAMFMASEIAAVNALNGGTGCFVGDKLFKKFEYKDISVGTTGVGVGPNDAFMLTQYGPYDEYHNINVTKSGAFINSKISFSYEVVVLGMLDLKTISGQVTGNTTSTWQLDITTSAIAAAPATVSVTDPNAATPVATWPDMTDYSTITNVLDSGDGAGVTQFSNVITQTPGPLPILGAGAVFGFSRKLRNRIKATI